MGKEAGMNNVKKRHGSKKGKKETRLG